MSANNNVLRNIVIPDKLPLLPVRDVVVFPHMVIPLSVGRAKSVKALEEAMSRDRLLILSTQRSSAVEDPRPQDVYDVGTVAEVLQLLKMGDGTVKVFIEGITRAKIESFVEKDEFFEVQIVQIAPSVPKTPSLEAEMRTVTVQFEQYVKLNRRLPIELTFSITNIEDPDRLVDTIAAHLIVKMNQKQELLATVNVYDRLEKLNSILIQENEILNLERKIQGRVRQQIEKSQKEYYLSEQMKAIQKELKQKDDYGKEIDELRKKIKEVKMTKEAEEAAEKELVRLEKMAPFSPEGTVVRTYLDWLINLPWSVKTQDNLDIERAEKVLNEDHYGLEKVKERILEYLAVCKLAKKIKGPILCFVGPPGTGKTSVARSIARALGRNFIRISLGGVRDEAEIRGHRRTYIGALPGRIIQSLRKAKSKNPVFLMDEIDKLGIDFRGDPAAALLEVLDPEQNSNFSDHYLDVGFDLTDVMFITTANTLYSIPPSLQDRMEVLRFSGYTQEEKIKIALRFLVPKQLKEHGLEEKAVSFSEEALVKIIKDYTQEAGVRNLEREIANVCRKVAKRIAVEKEKKEEFKITAANVHSYLGVEKFHHDLKGANEVGVATGLAWTETGGDTIAIEVTVMKGKGKLTLTGKLGEVMRESAQAALSYIRTRTTLLGQKGDFYKDKEVHIHVPEGAIPKDGPSAGIAIACALASAFSQRPVKKDVAMTGEITLRGRVLSIGGLKEKVLAAYRDGVKTVIFPDENQKDMEEIPKDIQKKLKFIPVKHMDKVLEIALEKQKEPRERRAE